MFTFVQLPVPDLLMACSSSSLSRARACGSRCFHSISANPAMISVDTLRRCLRASFHHFQPGFYPPKGCTDVSSHLAFVHLSTPQVVCVADSTSDSLDEILGRLFGDNEFRSAVNLGSVNSINIVRVLTQAVHYAYGYLRVAGRNPGAPVAYSIPTGAAGNLFGGFLAVQLGIPIARLVVANNSNSAIHELVSTGTMRRLVAEPTLSSAIDIVIPVSPRAMPRGKKVCICSPHTFPTPFAFLLLPPPWQYNLWRVLWLTACNRDSTALKALMDAFENDDAFSLDGDHVDSFADHVASFSIDDDETVATIAKYWARSKYLLDPHGAVAVRAAEMFLLERERQGLEYAIRLHESACRVYAQAFWEGNARITFRARLSPSLPRFPLSNPIKYVPTRRRPIPVVAMATASPAKFPECARRALELGPDDDLPAEATHPSIDANADAKQVLYQARNADHAERLLRSMMLGRCGGDGSEGGS